MSNRAAVDHWNKLHAQASRRIAAKADNIRLWIERYIPSASAASITGTTAVEIGCCPGRYLAVLGELGYEISGVDLADDIQVMPEWIKSQGYKSGSFWQENFLTFNFQRQFGVVMSLGFIEHFTNWKEVLERHCDLVSQGGYLVLEAPNFIGGFQHWLHLHLDKENFDRHHVPAMDVDEWAGIIQSRGFEIVFKGYFGKFDFWVENQKRNIWQKFALKLLTRFRKILKLLLPPDRKMYSPVGGVIARKLNV